MGYLFSLLPFQPGSRMTGIWTADPPLDGDDDLVGFGHLIRLGLLRPQDGEVESDFLASHLPFHDGGFHGVGPDGQAWAFLLQVAPVTAGDPAGVGSAQAVLADAMDRALQFNDDAEIVHARGWTREELLEAYEWQGIVDPNDLTCWSVPELLSGLLAECCYVPLDDIVAGWWTGCAFPGVEHRCEQEVFLDVFAHWGRGELRDLVPPAPGPPRRTAKRRPTGPSSASVDAAALRAFRTDGAQPSANSAFTFAHESPTAWRYLKADLSDTEYRSLRRAVTKAHGPLPAVRPITKKRVTPRADRDVAAERVHRTPPPGRAEDIEDVAVDLPPRRDCCLYHPGHTLHWIQVLKQAPKHPYVFGTLTVEPDAAGEGAFRFVPDMSVPHTLPDDECVETVLFNHTPDLLLARMATLGHVGKWIPGVPHIFKLDTDTGAHPFNMSLTPIGPCRTHEELDLQSAGDEGLEDWIRAWRSLEEDE